MIQQQKNVNIVNITIPKAIWSGDQKRYKEWIWETYGRYLNGHAEKENLRAVELNIKFARW